MKPHLSARVFYGVIIGGVFVGIAVCAIAGWAYLEYDDRKPTGRRIWATTASDFLIPVCVMVGATFGGMMGVAAAVLWERRRLKTKR